LKRALFISFYAPPCTLFPTSSFRIERLIKGLVAFGLRVDLVTLDPLSSFCTCPGCQAVRKGMDPSRFPPGVTIYRLKPESYGSLAKRITKEFSLTMQPQDRFSLRVQKLLFLLPSLLKGKEAHYRLLEPLETGYAFADAVFSFIEKEYLLPPDLILTSSGPYSLILVGKKLKKLFNSKWIADLRDSLSGHAYRHGRIHAWVFSLFSPLLLSALKDADAVISVSPEEAQRDERILKKPVLPVIPGWDPDEWEGTEPIPELKRDPRFKFLYAGRLYPGYITLLPFFTALNHLVEKVGKIQTVVYYYGPSKKVLLKDLESFPHLRPLVEIHEPIPPQEIRRVMRSVDLLLLPTSFRGEGGIGGGKLYEYLASRTPILSFPDDPFVSGILKETGGGISCSADPAELEKTLSQILVPEGSHNFPSPKEEEIRRYTYIETIRPLLQSLDLL
jgi:glycosyltransferase involved in cell wall biosynthesis